MAAAILHIGVEKTGTTSLQTYLSGTRDDLNRQGFHYSRAAGDTNHIRLCRYALSPEHYARFDKRFRGEAAEDRRNFQAAFTADLEEEIGRHPGRVFLFSSELLSSQLTSNGEVATLRDLLAAYFDPIRVLVYLRRQDELAVSRYSTAIRAGHSPQNMFSAANSDLFDYDRLLSRWANVFGSDALDIGLYETEGLRDGSVVTDFCQRLGLTHSGNAGAHANRSLRPEYQEFLRQLNMRLAETGNRILPRDRAFLLERLDAHGAGPGRLPARAEAQNFFARFAESNERVRARFFPQRRALFDDDFARYPVDAADSELDLDRALDIAAQLLADWIDDRRA